MRKTIQSVLMLCFCVSYLSAQQTITGTVFNEAHEPLIGATILVSGTSLGTVANLDGQFELIVPETSTLLKVSYTGYQEQKIKLSEGKTHFDLVLLDDIIGLEDVVVIGYSPQRRKDITGSVSSVSSEDIDDVVVPSIETALRGRAAGVQVFQNSGTPGTGINVRIRGNTSVSASNEPLYVIDGVPVITGNFSQVGVGGRGTNALSGLNPNEIESIEVLKDASSAAIYGSRAANGVVLITTKKGKAGKTKIDFNASYGIQERTRTIAFGDAAQYREQTEVLFGSPDAVVGGLGGDTNWGRKFSNLLLCKITV